MPPLPLVADLRDGLIASCFRISPMLWRLDIPQYAFAFERGVVTPYTFATVLIPAISSYYIMAVLVQIPRTHLYRAALLPVVLWMMLRANMSLDLSFNYPGYDYLNQGLALGVFILAMRSTTWVFVQQPYVRLSISKTATANFSGNTSTDGISFSSAMWNACDLLVNFRLIGWNEPYKKHIPVPYFRVESRRIFFLFSLCRLVFFVLALDIVCRAVRSFGPGTFGTPNGGTIFDSSLPPSQRYMKSSTVTFLSALAAYVIIETVYQIHAVLLAILFQQYPSQWPPLFDSPWLSTSLTDFWGRRWHQLFREFFVVVGGLLSRGFLGKTGICVGAFAISGALHDVGLRGMGRGGDTVPIVGFFVIHGVGVSMEYAWKRATGGRIGGITGWLWTASFLTVSGHLLVDAWARRGMLGSEFWPEHYSPTTLVVNAIFRKKCHCG